MSSKTDFLTKFDGSGREPRQVQKDVLNWIADNWDKTNTFCIKMPVGSGKSACAVAIATTLPNCRICTPSNQLVEQYSSEYPQLNKYYGMDNYDNVNKYKAAKDRALAPEILTVTNPAAEYFLAKMPDYRKADVIIIDEADQSIGLLSLMHTKKFKLTKEEFEDPPNTALALSQHIRSKLAEMAAENKFKGGGGKQKLLRDSKVEKYRMYIKTLDEESEKIAIWPESETKWKGKRRYTFYYICMKSILIPQHVVNDFLGYGTKVILMGATIFEADLREMAPNRGFLVYEAPSPIDISRRQVLYSPLGCELAFPRPIQEIADKIDAILNATPHLRPCLIHATYSTAREIAEAMRNEVCYYNIKDDKKGMLENWMKEGGVIIAPGCSTGLDLKDSLCRLNIITQLNFADLGSPLVQKKLAATGGQEWYANNCIRHITQAVGRSTRNEKDHSLTVIVDPRFSRFYNKWKANFPKSFRESLIWSIDSLDMTHLEENVLTESIDSDTLKLQQSTKEDTNE